MLLYGENQKSLSYLVLERYQDMVTPRQTPGQNYHC